MWPKRVIAFFPSQSVGLLVKTIRIEFPVLASSNAPALLDLVTSVRGVVAAIVSGNALEVAVGSSECALLVREEVIGALASDPGVPA